MRLVFNFSAISSLFDVPRITGTIFFYLDNATLFQNYPNCRAIIDCTELHCDTPPTVKQRVLMYSSYKCGFTIMVAITPSEYISFISNGFGSRTSYGIIVNSSGFIK